MHGLYRPAWQRKDRQKRALSLSTLKKRSWKRSTVNYYLFVFLLFSLFQLAQATSSHHHHQSHSHSRTLGRERRSETGKKRLQLGARQLLGAEVSPGGGTATDAAANGDNQAVDVARATDALTGSSVNNSTITDAQTTTSQSSDLETATPSQTSSDSVKRSISSSSSSSSSVSTTSTTSPTTSPLPPSTPAPIPTPSFTPTPTPPPTATPPPKKAEQGLVSFLFDKKKNKFFPAVIAGCVLIGFAVILVVLFIFRFVAQRRYARTQYKRFVPVFDGPSDSSTGAASNEKGAAGMDAAPPIAIASRQLPDALFSRPAPARLADNDSLLFLDRRRLQRPPPQQQRRQRQQQMPEVQPEPIVYRHPTKRREREASQNSATSINSNGPPPMIPPTFTRPATPQRYPDARGLFISKVQPPAPVYHPQELSRPAMQQMSNWESMMVPSQAPADGNASHRPEVSHRDHRNQGRVAKDPIHAAVEQMLERKKSEEISRARAPARDLGDGKRKERKKGQAIRKRRTD